MRVHAQIQHLVFFNDVVGEIVHNVGLDVAEQRLLELLDYSFAAGGRSILEYLIQQVERHDF